VEAILFRSVALSDARNLIVSNCSPRKIDTPVLSRLWTAIPLVGRVNEAAVETAITWPQGINLHPMSQPRRRRQEPSMLRFLNKVFGTASVSRKHRTVSLNSRSFQPSVENLEERLVMSTAALRLPVPEKAPALVAPLDHSSETPVVDPERCHCVHGYKWRPRPLTASLSQGEPASQKPLAPLEHSTGLPIVDPETVVHGYKWRKYRPRWSYHITPSQGEVFKSVLPMTAPDATVADKRAHTAEVTGVVSGNADGKLVTIAWTGHITVQPPHGPAATASLTTKG
jgi:hypothetical protein